MTELEKKLEGDLAIALKTRLPELSTLRLLKSALKNESLSHSADYILSETEVIAVLRREYKKRQEAARLYTQGERAELAEKESVEAKIIEHYLPPAPNIEEVKRRAQQIIKEQNLSGLASIGILTKALLNQYQSALDGQTASSVARELLNQT